MFSEYFLSVSKCGFEITLLLGELLKFVLLNFSEAMNDYYQTNRGPNG